MVYAMDNHALAFLKKKGFYNNIHLSDKNDVVREYEIRLSRILIEQGWNISCLIEPYATLDYRQKVINPNPTALSGDPSFGHAYFGRTLHPYEILFIKTNRKSISIAFIESLCAEMELRQKAPEAFTRLLAASKDLKQENAPPSVKQALKLLRRAIKTRLRTYFSPK